MISRAEIITFYGTGGGGGGCVITRTDPVPEDHGGLDAGTTIAGETPCSVLEQILFPGDLFEFTAFYIDSVQSTREVGNALPAGTYTFRWNTVHDESLQPNTIDILDISGGTTLVENTDNDKTEDIALNEINRTSPGSYVWRIRGDTVSGDTKSRDYAIRWQYRKFWGWNTNDSLTEDDIKNLSDSTLGTSYAGTYNFTNPGQAVYYYVVYPDAWGDYNIWRNSENDFDIDSTYVGTVDVTNDYGVTVTYKVWRTTYLQNGDLDTYMN